MIRNVFVDDEGMNDHLNAGLANPGLTNPGRTNPGLANPGLANPGVASNRGLPIEFILMNIRSYNRLISLV